MDSPTFKKLTAAALTILFLAAGCARTMAPNKKINVMPTSYAKKLEIGQNKLDVEVADTTSKQQQGLSGRKPLTDSQGMLFDFKNTGAAAPEFWMKDMNFSLDFIWINNNKIVGITPNVLAPAPGTPDSQLIRYSPPEPVDQVLEVNAQWSKSHSAQVGDSIKFKN